VGTAAIGCPVEQRSTFLTSSKDDGACADPAAAEGGCPHIAIARRLQLIMARGWESKSVEQQQEEATSSQRQGKLLTPEQIVEQQKLSGLELSRQRILQQLEVASNPQHRSMLEAALAELDAQLKASKP
jgi:hypothetical protein